jgi:hypothetical protein
MRPHGGGEGGIEGSLLPEAMLDRGFLAPIHKIIFRRSKK